MLFTHSPAEGHLGYFQVLVITKTSLYKYLLCELEFLLYLEMGLLCHMVSDVNFYMKLLSSNCLPLEVHEHSNGSKCLPASGILSYFYFTQSKQCCIRLLGLT